MAKANISYPLSQISIAILEAFIEPIIGQKAIERIQLAAKDKEYRNKIVGALTNTEKRFISEHRNPDICQAVLGLPLSNLPSLRSAVISYYDRPTDPTLSILLKQKIRDDFHSTFTEHQIDSAVREYIEILRQEFTSVSEEIRQKIQTLSIIEIEKGVRKLADRIPDSKDAKQVISRAGSVPPMPSLVIGREKDVRALKRKLGIGTKKSGNLIQPLIAVRGWPGVGKTTLASVLAHDLEVAHKYSDGILWTSLGPNPNLLSSLAVWGRSLGSEHILNAKTIDEVSSQLAGLLRDRRMLLIVDDVWKPEHVMPFRIGGKDCAMLFTTRAFDVAQIIAATPDYIYNLPVLTENNAIKLFKELIPNIVAHYPKPCRELIRELESLPLALQVAGRLLSSEESYGFNVLDLLRDLRDGVKILAAQAPGDRTDVANDTIPSVAVLLQKSTERLDSYTYDCFAYLGAFAPKPATFDLAAMKSVWQVDDPKPIVRILVDRGLLEPIPETGRFQMHALLVAHAKSLQIVDNPKT